MNRSFVAVSNIDYGKSDGTAFVACFIAQICLAAQGTWMLAYHQTLLYINLSLLVLKNCDFLD